MYRWRSNAAFPFLCIQHVEMSFTARTNWLRTSHVNDQKQVYEGKHISEPCAYQQAEVGCFGPKGNWYCIDAVVRAKAVWSPASNRRPASHFCFCPNMNKCPLLLFQVKYNKGLSNIYWGHGVDANGNCHLKKLKARCPKKNIFRF